jgi:hypothetical protein
MKILTLVVGAAVAGLVLAGGAQTAPGNGAAFGTRNTRDCGTNKDAPSSAELQQVFICEYEFYTPAGTSGAKINLVSNVAMQFSKGRPYNANTDAYSSIDVTQPVHGVRGNYIGWTCFVPTSPAYGNAPQPAKNCWKYLGTGVKGIAFRDTFGSWHVKVCCTVGADGSSIVYYPPPTEM